MLFVFYGTEDYLLQKEVDKIIKENHIDHLSINRYGEDNCNIENMIEDLNTVSMFGNKKLIIVDQATFLTGNSKKTITDMEQKRLEMYLEKPNPSSFLVFVVHHEKLDERKKIVKCLKKHATIKLCEKTNPKQLVRDLFHGYEIEEDVLSLFIDRVGDNILQLEQEAEKLKLYCIETKVIQKKDIYDLTVKTIDLNIFTFIDNIISQKREKAIEAYEEMLKINEEPIVLVIMLANQFRIMYQGKELLKKGYSEKSIAETLNVHPFRIKKALEKARLYTSDILLFYLKKLIQLDINIKRGRVNKNLALELFILEI